MRTRNERVRTERVYVKNRDVDPGKINVGKYVSSKCGRDEKKKEVKRRYMRTW
jgi:hypothetical protein